MKKNRLIGCADPYSIAESIVGENIDWSKEKDEFDALAKCFGITKEGFLSDESPIEAPYLAIGDDGQPYRLSDAEAEKRVSDFLEKYARPLPLNAKRSKQEIANSKKNVLNTILGKDIKDAASESSENTNALKISEKDDSQLDELLVDETLVEPDKLKVNAGSSDPQNTGNYVWKEKGYFFNEVALWSDVCQNSIGDCYFLAALCSVAYVNPFKIKNTTGLRYVNGEGSKALSPWHEIQFYVPSTSDSDYAALQSKKNTVQTVVVSEDVLVSKSTNYNYGVCGPKEKQGSIPASKADADSCWAAVYEKAFAKFLENTSSDKPNMKGKIEGGWPELALKAILHTNKVKKEKLSRKSIDDIWQLAKTAWTRPICATILEKAGNKSYYNNLGLYTYHVYSLLGYSSKDDKKYIVLRNPHGRNPSSLKNNPKVYHKNWGYYYIVNSAPEYRSPVDVFRHLSGNDDPQKSQGLFLLEINEFKRVFDEISYYYGDSSFAANV